MVAKANLVSSRRSTQSNKSATVGVSMGSFEIAMTTVEMEAGMDVELDAENGDVMDAKTTAEMTN